MIWLFLILALSTVAVSLVGLAAYLRVRSHMKDVLQRNPRQGLTTAFPLRPVAYVSDSDTENLQHGEAR